MGGRGGCGRAHRDRSVDAGCRVCSHYGGGAPNRGRTQLTRQRVRHRHPAHWLCRSPVYTCGVSRGRRSLKGPPRSARAHACRPRGMGGTDVGGGAGERGECGGVMWWTAEVTGRFLGAQVLAGASAAQLFDSWAGSLSVADYERHTAPASRQALSFVHELGYEIAGVRRSVPIVHFGTGTGELLGAMREVGGDVIGVDHRVPLDVAAGRVGAGVPLQGNLDPALLSAPVTVMDAAVRDVPARGPAAPGHVFNLGHGVPPGTDPAVLTRIVTVVHEDAAA